MSITPSDLSSEVKVREESSALPEERKISALLSMIDESPEVKEMSERVMIPVVVLVTNIPSADVMVTPILDRDALPAPLTTNPVPSSEMAALFCASGDVTVMDEVMCE